MVNLRSRLVAWRWQFYVHFVVGKTFNGPFTCLFRFTSNRKPCHDFSSTKNSVVRTYLMVAKVWLLMETFEYFLVPV